MNQHAPLFPLAVCLIAGIAVSSLLPHWTTGLAVLVVCTLVTVLLSRWPRWQTAGIWLCVLVLGMTLGARSLGGLGDGSPDHSRHTTTDQENRPLIQQRFLGWRDALLEQYQTWGISDEAYGVLAAMTLGEKSHIDKEIRNTYREVGASHILALSGLHLMIIYSVISLLVSWRRVRMLSQIIIILAIWSFALLTGLSPSITRSAAMITVYGLLSLGYRKGMSLNTLAFVAIIMLAINPQSLYNIGFQLSFMAVLAIVLINPLLFGIIPPHVRQQHRWLSGLWGMTTVSISAQIGTAPLVVYYFGYFPVWFLLTNYIVIPLATVILYLTPVLVAVSWWPWGVGIMAKALSAIVMFMNRLLEWVSTLPYCTIDGISISTLQVFLLYIIIGSVYVVVSLRYPATGRSD